MTSILAIILNVALDLTLIALLALVVTRAARLTPHKGQGAPAGAPAGAPERSRAARRRPPRAGERGRRLQPALD